jgi:DNA-directed RNA polymerase III subunit RPC1
MADGLEAVDLPAPALLKPLEMWTGKQVASLLVRPSGATQIFVNLEMAEKVGGEPAGAWSPADLLWAGQPPPLR